VSKERLKALLAEYGPIALGTYFALFFVVLLSFAGAISLGLRDTVTAWFSRWGLDTESFAQAGVWLAAWIVTKLTQPLRILATVALTPVVARVLERWRPAREP